MTSKYLAEKEKEYITFFQNRSSNFYLQGGLVSKETVVLRWWGRETQNLRWPIYLINSVDKSKFLLELMFVWEYSSENTFINQSLIINCHIFLTSG